MYVTFWLFCPCLCVEARVRYWISSSIVSHLIFWGRIARWSWSLLIWLARLASRFQGSTTLCPPNPTFQHWVGSQRIGVPSSMWYWYPTSAPHASKHFAECAFSLATTHWFYIQSLVVFFEQVGLSQVSLQLTATISLSLLSADISGMHYHSDSFTYR